MDARYFWDLHTHSTDASDDAGATVEGYLKWLAGRRRKGYQVDGFVLTEHRSFDHDLDYSALSRQYGVMVLKGTEIETEIGHVLVFGVNRSFYNEFDFTRVDLSSREVFAAAKELGCYAVAAHAGRPRIGIWDHAQAGTDMDHVPAIESLNGGSSREENGRAALLVERYGFQQVGGSDAHYVSHVGLCLTEFPHPVSAIEDLVEQLRAGDYRPVTIEDTFRGVE